jgi:hypothetical protein
LKAIKKTAGLKHFCEAKILSAFFTIKHLTAFSAKRKFSLPSFGIEGRVKGVLKKFKVVEGC